MRMGLRRHRGLALGFDVFRAYSSAGVEKSSAGVDLYVFRALGLFIVIFDSKPVHTFEGRDWSGPVEKSQLSYYVDGHFVFSSEEFDIHRRFLEVSCTPQCLDRP